MYTEQPPNHSYATRISQNITIKPSARLRQSPEPIRKAKHESSTKNLPSTSRNTIQPEPSKNSPSTSTNLHTIQPKPAEEIPEFPPSNVILHKDDANSSVFMAIARSLLSVDNRATTVKDLADLAVNNGLGCQNSSAASQAITTYIRVHNARCEAENDQPLLLSHTMSGTDADDDLIPALYSLQGGNPRKMSVTRMTNFRKNTSVWYLSRATGAPCPFARAGIRLCDYEDIGMVEDGDEPQGRRRSRLHDNPEFIGQKRKRLRSCAAKDFESDDEFDKPPPPKKPLMKFTFQGVPLHTASDVQQDRHRSTSQDISDAEDSMEVVGSCLDEESESNENREEEWRLPPYPRRSISIPCYTPSYDGSYPPFPIPTDYRESYRRSPSIPGSVGSPPPDSEDEADDYHIMMTRALSFPEDSGSDSDSDDGETRFESPGPRSPSAPLIPPLARITVKEEPRDLQGLLDAWDDFDSSLADGKAVPTYNETYQEEDSFKSETSDLWNWDAEPSIRVKEEDLSFDSLFAASSSSSSSPPVLSPPSSSLSPSSSTPPNMYDTDYEWEAHSSRPAGSLRPRSKTAPVISYESPRFSTASAPLTVWPITTLGDSPSDETKPELIPQSNNSTNLVSSVASFIQSMSLLSTPSTVSPSSLVLLSTDTPAPSPQIVVHTCQPCSPPIVATYIEGVAVYQMTIDTFQFVRRIDTDFVNLSPVVNYTKAPFPVPSTIPDATVICKGSPLIAGIWVPLSVAQSYIKDHPTRGEFDVFLSDQLHERFPPALQQYYMSSASERSLNKFGPPFVSMTQAQTAPNLPTPPPPTPASIAEVLAKQHQPVIVAASSPLLHLDLPPLVAISSSSSDAYALSTALTLVEKQHEELQESPLSATEQEIFELCVADWEAGSACSKEGSMDVDSEQDPRRKESIDRLDDEDVSDASSLTSLESMSPSTPEHDASIKRTQLTTCDVVCSAVGKEENEALDVTLAGPIPAASVEKKQSVDPRPLRRSRRVADLAASHQKTPPNSVGSAKTKGRRRGSTRA